MDETIYYGGDSEVTGEQRTPCYAAWTAYRDRQEDDNVSPDLCSFRAGFLYGWDARTNQHATLVAALEKIGGRGCYNVDGPCREIRTLAVDGWCGPCIATSALAEIAEVKSK